MLKKLIVAFCLAIPFLAGAQTVKIGIVDTNVLLEALPETKEATETLKKQYDDNKAVYDSLTQELQRKYEEYQALPEGTSEATLKLKAEELSSTQQRIASFQENAEAELNKKRESLLAPIYQKILTAIESVGAEDDYTVIQEKASVIYFKSPAVDITDTVKAKLLK